MESATASAARPRRGSLLRIQSDERLAQLASSGRDDAFEVLVRRHRRSLVRAARRILAEDRAEDAVQQALLDAHRALDRGEPPDRFRPWLHRITVNAALKELRADGDTVPLAEELNGVEGPADAHERRESLRRTLRAVRDLPERQRRALVARELEGRSHAEIARELGLTGGAVRQLIHRARNSVRSAVSALVPPVFLLRLLGGAGAAPAPVTEVTAGGGGAAVVTKVATVAVIVGGVAGGVALDRKDAGPSRGSGAVEARGPSSGDEGSGGTDPLAAVAGPAVGSGGSGSSGGPGGAGSHGGDGSSGPGSRDGGNSGPGSDASGSRSSGSGSSGSDSSGHGSGDEPEEIEVEDEVEVEDGSSGPGSSGGGSLSSGSGSSGSGSSGSVSSGSGSSGSSIPSDSSGSGSSGSGSSGSGSDDAYDD